MAAWISCHRQEEKLTSSILFNSMSNDRTETILAHCCVCWFFFPPECSMKLYLYVSGDGRKVLLTTPTACVFLWESTEHENTASCKNSSSGRWTQILPDESVILPSTEEKEIGVHAAFIQNEVKNKP